MSGHNDLVASEGELRIRLQRQGDRFGHQLFARDMLLANSHEGVDQDWPPSPPLQQLSVEDLGNGPVGLLVGMAGRSHWSLSIEERNGGFVFDAACRVSGASGFLGSSYRLSQLECDPVEVANATTRNTIKFVNEQGSLTWHIDEDAQLAKCQFSWDSQSRQLCLIATPRGNIGETVRWRYWAEFAK